MGPQYQLIDMEGWTELTDAYGINDLGQISSYGAIGGKCTRSADPVFDAIESRTPPSRATLESRLFTQNVPLQSLSDRRPLLLITSYEQNQIHSCR